MTKNRIGFRAELCVIDKSLVLAMKSPQRQIYQLWYAFKKVPKASKQSAHKPMSDITVATPLLCTTQATIYNRFKVISSARTIQIISCFKHCEDSKHLNCDRGFYVLLTALQSVWYHFAPQALRLQLCWLRGLSRDEHSYGGMTENPSFDFIKHTTDLCWVPVPHSAEHYAQLNTKSRKKNPCDMLM